MFHHDKWGFSPWGMLKFLWLYTRISDSYLQALSKTCSMWVKKVIWEIKLKNPWNPAHLNKTTTISRRCASNRRLTVLDCSTKELNYDHVLKYYFGGHYLVLFPMLTFHLYYCSVFRSGLFRMQAHNMAILWRLLIPLLKNS